MVKKIASVGVALASDSVHEISLLSRKSLLDYDVILFRPDLSEIDADGSYMGKRSFGDYESTSLSEAAKHWIAQIEESTASGKTVFVFLCSLEEVYIATGEKQYSGTGRSQKTTRIVKSFYNYLMAGVPSHWRAVEGTEMILDPQYRELLGSYWRVLESRSTYHATWDYNKPTSCIGTKAGGRATGLCIRAKETGGTVFLLPDLDFDNVDFTEWDDDHQQDVWTEEGERFAQTLVSELLEISKISTSSFEKSAAPAWTLNPQFILPGEAGKRAEIEATEQEIIVLSNKMDRQLAELTETEKMKDLLFESGKPLEDAILRALRVLGFSAENFTNEKSEFDAVFTCAEGRLIGEAEGKDNKQINITKLRQLSANILEDLDREEVTVPAKGVLFGNAFRFTPPDQRDSSFTDKCVSTASTASIALVDTCRLFRVVAYCLENNTGEVAAEFRKRLLSEKGVIEVDDLIPSQGK